MKADAHLTYIGSSDGLHSDAYDVYPREGGPQLGVVERSGPRYWEAYAPHGYAEGDARWVAATKLWPEGGK